MFEVHTQSRDGHVEVAATGELDLATRDRLRSAVSAALTRGTLVVLDLRGVTFVDSTGLQTILELDSAARASANGTRLSIVPSDEVVRVLRLTGLDRLLPLE